jgi:hypothetical protein
MKAEIFEHGLGLRLGRVETALTAAASVFGPLHAKPGTDGLDKVAWLP